MTTWQLPWDWLLLYFTLDLDLSQLIWEVTWIYTKTQSCDIEIDIKKHAKIKTELLIISKASKSWMCPVVCRDRSVHLMSCGDFHFKSEVLIIKLIISLWFTTWLNDTLSLLFISFSSAGYIAPILLSNLSHHQLLFWTHSVFCRRPCPPLSVSSGQAQWDQLCPWHSWQGGNQGRLLWVSSGYRSFSC